MKISNLSNLNSENKDEIFILSTHLDLLEEIKLFNLKKKMEFHSNIENEDGTLFTDNNKFYTVICKCINYEELIWKSDRTYSEDLPNNIVNGEDGLNDVMDIGANYNFDSGRNIVEISNENQDKKILLIKNQAIFVPEYIIEYNYMIHNSKTNNNCNNKDSKIINNNGNTINLNNSQSKYELNLSSLNNIIISSYILLREGKLSELKSEYIRNFNNSLRILTNSEVSNHINKTIINKNFICNFQFFDEINNTDIFFAKNSILNFLNHCFKFLNKDTFYYEFNKIKDNLLDIKNANLTNPAVSINIPTINNSISKKTNKGFIELSSMKRKTKLNNNDQKINNTENEFYPETQFKNKMENKDYKYNDKIDCKIMNSDGTLSSEGLVFL